MKNNPDLNEGELMTQLREHYSDELSPELKRKLQQARHIALDSLDKPSMFRQNWVAPALGVSAAFAVAVGFFWQTGQASDLGQLTATNLDLADLVFISEIQNEDINLLNASLDEGIDLGFFTWIEQQPEFME